MATVSELKDSARALEDEGQLDKALAIYEHILNHFEGKPSVIRVLSIYTKVGDLRSALNRTDEAVEAYLTGAGHYARTGAAQRVTELCERIRTLDPTRETIDLEFARQLLDKGHAGSARDVLASYARYAKRPKAFEALENLAGRPNDEVHPHLEELLESLERREEAVADETAERVTGLLQQATDEAAGEVAEAPPPPARVAQPVAAAPPPELTPEPELPVVPELVPEPEPAPKPPPPPPPPPPPTPPRASRISTPRAYVPRAAHGGSRLPAAVGGFVVGLAAGVGLALAGILPIGGDGAAGEPAEALSAATDTVAPGDTTGAAAAATPMVRQPPDTRDTSRTAPPVGPPGIGVAAMPATYIVVDGLAVVEVAPNRYQRRTGVRATQRLVSGEVLVVESYALDSDTAGLGPAGVVQLIPTAGDTVLGIVRLERHLVRVLATLPQDSVRALLRRLVERER